MTNILLSARSFTEQETAQYIGMSRSYLRQGRMNGDRKNKTPAPPYLKIGRSIRYLKEDLDSWLEQFRQRPGIPSEGHNSRVDR
jgi:predicted DNA-binding transcriptional regulator AlpA